MERYRDWLSKLMEDATDFTWQSTKASHVVLLCEIERVLLNGRTLTGSIELEECMRKSRSWSQNLIGQRMTPKISLGFVNSFRSVHVNKNGKSQKYIRAYCLMLGNHPGKDVLKKKQLLTKNEQSAAHH